MILDQLSASAAYESLHPLFPRAFAYLRSFDLATADGKHELQGQDLVAIVQRYQTAPSADKSWEAHRVYGDIQVVYQGLESCGHADQRTLVVTKETVRRSFIWKRDNLLHFSYHSYFFMLSDYAICHIWFCCFVNKPVALIFLIF